MGKPLHWIVILQPVSSTFAYTYEPWYRGDTKRPVDVITDVVNDLGVKILQQYSSHGNVAFSPTGVAFVLAALYEGSAGRGSQQIADAMGLPANRDVTRIGFRDIHRRLRTYLNADGFLGGLTLSRENTKLRPEYEDVLRFYGFDLSSIEQEANVTVSVEDTSATSELPTSTVDLTSVETTSTGSPTDTTTLTTDAGTTLSSSAAAQTTITPSTAAPATTQQTITMPMNANVTTTSAPTATSAPVPQNTPSSSPTTVTSDQSAQPLPSADAENFTSGPNMVITPMGSQTGTDTVSMAVIAGDQDAQMPTAAGDIATDEAAAAVTALDTNLNTQSIPDTSIRVPSATATTMLMAPAGEIPSTFATNTEIMMDVTETTAETVAAADTTVSNITPATVTEIMNTANSNSPAPVTPITPDTATVPSPASGTMMDSNIVPQQNTESSMTPSIPAGDTSGTTIDFTTTPMTGAEDTSAPISTEGLETTTVISPVPATNGTLDGLAGNSNNSTITNLNNSTAAASIGNQTAASLVDENMIAMSRKKKSIGIEVTVLGSEMRDITRDNTVKDESASNKLVHLRKRRARSPRGYFSSYPDEGIWMQDLDIWKSYSTMSPRESSDDSTSEISFLVNGCDVYSVSGSRYIAVLPFAYFPSLHAVALEFPLDDPRYNIILFMPTDRTDTHRLARDLSEKSLRSLRKRLQPTWVRATIPSFMLRGFVTLTSLLQRLGITDVFEPRVADLSPMTADLGVYARDVQQSIGVNIRNYMKPDRTHSRNGLFERAGPVPFTVMHPFLYFIVDAETSVSLIAGRVDDPLNSRIL